MKKILITGGSGFIGRNLVEGLADAYEVLSPVRAELDLLDENAVQTYLSKHHFNVIIHTATWNATRNSSKDLNKVLDHNLRMFFNLTRCQGEYGKLIYYGSGAEFSRPHWQPKMGEDYFDTHIPTDAYGFSKYIMARHTEQLDNVYNLRLFGVFGKYEDWEIRFISHAICKALYDLPITIRQNVRFDYLYVDDLVNITQWFLENKPSHRIYNICTGKSYDLMTLANKVNDAIGKIVDIIVAKNGMGREYSGDNRRWLGEMGGYTFSEIESAIQQLVGWYQQNLHRIDYKLLLNDK